MINDILELIISVFKQNTTMGIILVSFGIIGLLVFVIIKVIRSKKSMDGAAAGIAKSLVGTADNLKRHNDISLAYHKQTKMAIDQLKSQVNDNYNELKVAVDSQKETVKSLKEKLESIQKDMIQADAQNYATMKGIIDNLETVTDKVMDISSSLNTVILGIIKDLAGRR